MVDFGGWDMPLHYGSQLNEHHQVRRDAGLFDVSHMGPCFFLPGPNTPRGHEIIAQFVETVVPADIAGLKPGQVRYTTLMNAEGGVRDDLMIARPAEPELAGTLHIVVNASMKEQDFALLTQAGAGMAEIERAVEGSCLLALQGPKAAEAIASIIPGAEAMKFMTLRLFAEFGGVFVTRSGYTGEDGFEILVGPDAAADLAERLLADARVKPIGLGARDTLRLEAGLCLYGHELDPEISPIEADLAWTIQKRRRAAGDFLGAPRVLAELHDGPARKRVGIRPADRAPARDGTEIQSGGRKIGIVTSGGFSPTLNAPISMGYVEAAFATPGTKIELIVRGQARAAEIVALPFVPHNYFKG